MTVRPQEQKRVAAAGGAEVRAGKCKLDGEVPPRMTIGSDEDLPIVNRACSMICSVVRSLPNERPAPRWSLLRPRAQMEPLRQ